MEDKNFDWQGKKRENVEFSYKMIFWSTLICLGMLLTISFFGLLDLFK